MAPERQREIDELYKKAQKILSYELTQAEQSFIAELGIVNHANLPDDKLSLLRELVRKHGPK